MAKKKKSSYGGASEYNEPGHSHGKGKGGPANPHHPHRGPHGLPDGMVTGDEHDHHHALDLDGHTFGMDEAYDHTGHDHHLGNNVCAED